MGMSVLIFLTGCQHTQAASPTLKTSDPKFLKSYFTRVSKYDGIDESEARLLAQSQLKFEGRDSAYYIDHPQTIPYDEDHWLIEFPPVNKTFGEARHSSSIIFIIDKTSGSVRHFQQ